jgi:predicted transcriptional regulator
LSYGRRDDPCISEILLIIPRDRRGIVRINRINLVGRFIASTSSELRSSFVDGSELDLTSFTAEIVSAYVVNNTLARDQLPAMISSVWAALNTAVAHTGEPLKGELKPAVPIKKSVTTDYIVCLEDGKKFKSIKRHLQSHDMSPEQYREKWGLARDYPMVAPAYAAARSQLAKSFGLGQRRYSPDRGPAGRS